MSNAEGIPDMAAIQYKVPLVAQARTMSCWYAAACMVAYAYEPGPRYGIPQIWLGNRGLPFARLAELAWNEKMRVLRSASHEFTPASMISTLSFYGPIWAGGNWFGVPHAVVITGADDVGSGNIVFNDPDGGVVKTGTIPWLNERRVRGAMMARGYPPRLQP